VKESCFSFESTSGDLAVSWVRPPSHSLTSAVVEEDSPSHSTSLLAAVLQLL